VAPGESSKPSTLSLFWSASRLRPRRRRWSRKAAMPWQRGFDYCSPWHAVWNLLWWDMQVTAREGSLYDENPELQLQWPPCDLPLGARIGICVSGLDHDLLQYIYIYIVNILPKVLARVLEGWWTCTRGLQGLLKLWVDLGAGKNAFLGYHLLKPAHLERAFRILSTCCTSHTHIYI